ncbi:hypothetical protein DFH09DRAFT_21612 [Mycena vulgaris]|nr:hypothetical protein DFH09DRAFT_21612 [Mycena vulgaris]
MSHLTASPFHKPSAFEFPQRTSSVETHPSAQLPTPASLAGPDHHPAEYFDTPPASISPEGPGSRLRKAASSIVYHTSGLRESRERTVQRSSRTFVVVLPPPSLPQDHGHLGHTLGSGPRHRLSQGLLMPLFPTMYGQLTAIAREYNFPSTTGLCLYLHFTEHGITATPRISDDSWQMIWNHAFDPAPSSSAAPSLPISGKIEFDIDLRLARWYGAWMASSHREHVDVPMSVTPSATPSIIHYREESRTTFADGDDQDTSVARAPIRHVPRKLSLIDRFDAMSARSVPRSVVARAPPAETLPGSQNLSPIFQEDEPKTAKYDLEHRVNSWRASASILPGAIAEAGHILIAGPNLPNSPLDESPMPTTGNDDEHNEYEYRIEDYSWSISSEGPGDYNPYSPLSWHYDPSVHLAHRAQGSVCMTPSDCTSFGPSDYTLPSYAPSLNLRVHTPDIAHRMFEDVPPSPSVATSWGAPSYPPSPTSEYRAPSVDLAHRQHFSRPVTPMTATSWGAPESFPPSPTTPFYVHTPDAGQRAFDLSDHEAPWSMVWPYHDTSRPWTQVWPYHSAQAAQEEEQRSPARPWNMVWPYQATRTGPWNMVWPYHATHTGPSRHISVAHPSVYPCLNIYPAVYPHFDLYPAASGAFTDTARAAPQGAKGPVTIRLAAAYPVFDLYPATYPGNLDEIYPAQTINDAPLVISTRLSPRYPSFDLYPAVYPHIVPYPPFRHEMEVLSAPVSSSAHYPQFNLYPPIATSATTQSSLPSRGPVSVVLRTAYPVFNLYPAIYPVFNIYPALDNGAGAIGRSAVSIRLTTAYPVFNLYPATYPVFDLYPALPEDCWGPRVLSAGYPDFNIYPAVSRSRQAPRMKVTGSPDVVGPISVRLPASYPIFDLYPPVYPVLEIYPAIPEDCTPGSRRDSGVSVRLAACYPIFNLYPAIYPVFEIYPSLPEDCAPGSRQRPGVSVRLAVAYPIFDLYPAVYPTFEIYPSLPEDCAPGSRQRPGVSVRLAVAYPIFDLYPAVYPTFEIYPSLPEDCAPGSRQRPGVSVRLAVAYPIFDLYPAVYPTFEIYPSLPEDCAPGSRPTSGISVRLAVAYPIFDLYPAVYPALKIYPSLPEDRFESQTYGYPYFNLYPAVSGRAVVAKAKRSEMVCHSVKYPNFNLYPAVYPYFDLYPEAWITADIRGVHVEAVARYPVFNLYPAVYPFFDLYPGAWEGPEETGVDIRVEARYPYFNLYSAIYPHFDLWPTLSLMETPRLATQTKFTRSDLHALVTRSPLNSRPNVRVPFNSHQALHLAVFPRGADVLTPSGSVQHNAGKTHLQLHRSVFPSDVDVSTPSGTGPLKDASTPSGPPRPATRLRAGSVRMSLPPSPRPIGGRSPTVRAAPSIPLPAAPTATSRRTLSTTTRPSVVDRVAHSGASLSRSVSMVSPQASIPESPQLDRAASVNGPRANPRQSLVLQRVRAFQMQTEEPIKEDDPVSSFPLPPRSSHPPRKVVS